MATRRRTILQRIHHYPAILKEGELRSAVEKIVQQEQAKGIRAHLFQKVVWGDGPELVHTSLFDSMADYQNYREQTLASPERAELRMASGNMRRKPTRRVLAESIVSPLTLPAVQQGRYVHTITMYPSMGKVPEVRKIIEEFAREYQQAGRPLFRVFRNLFVPEGGTTLTQADTYASLSEYEEVDMRNLSPLVGQMVAKLAPLCERPQYQELYQVLIGPQA